MSVCSAVLFLRKQTVVCSSVAMSWLACLNFAYPCIGVDLGAPRTYVLDRGAHLCHLASTTEPPIFSGDAVLLSDYFEHLLSFNSTNCI